MFSQNIFKKAPGNDDGLDDVKFSNFKPDIYSLIDIE